MRPISTRRWRLWVSRSSLLVMASMRRLRYPTSRKLRHGERLRLVTAPGFAAMTGKVRSRASERASYSATWPLALPVKRRACPLSGSIIVVSGDGPASAWSSGAPLMSVANSAWWSAEYITTCPSSATSTICTPPRAPFPPGGRGSSIDRMCAQRPGEMRQTATVPSSAPETTIPRASEAETQVTGPAWQHSTASGVWTSGVLLRPTL
mmetsp:Transcript_32543/g.76652  ORF Transcript_32543/g.76652 Transcript_32543/m.76652 type:complete len:208 (-) Transcript_32543:2214-2837(-)